MLNFILAFVVQLIGIILGIGFYEFVKDIRRYGRMKKNFPEFNDLWCYELSRDYDKLWEYVRQYRIKVPVWYYSGPTEHMNRGFDPGYVEASFGSVHIWKDRLNPLDHAATIDEFKIMCHNLEIVYIKPDPIIHLIGRNR